MQDFAERTWISKLSKERTMEDINCSKTIVDKSWLGHVHRQCTKPVYKDGLCKHHYDRKIEKAIKYQYREDYREPTFEELKSGKLLHLKNMGSYGGHRCVKNIIMTQGGTGKPTDYPLDPKLFVIRDKP